MTALLLLENWPASPFARRTFEVVWQLDENLSLEPFLSRASGIMPPPPPPVNCRAWSYTSFALLTRGTGRGLISPLFRRSRAPVIHSRDIISRIGKHARHITMARSWLGCLLGVLVPSVVFYLYLLLNGNCDVVAHRFLFNVKRHQRTLFPVPSAEVGKSSIGGKWRSLSLGMERSNLRPEDRSPEWSQSKNNIEVKKEKKTPVKSYSFVSVRCTSGEWCSTFSRWNATRYT